MEHNANLVEFALPVTPFQTLAYLTVGGGRTTLRFILNQDIGGSGYSMTDSR
jgi:hypothetical protein